MYTYTVSLAPAGEGGFVVTLPAFPEVVTQGESRAEALASAQDALDEALANRIVHGMEIPRPSRAKSSSVVEASPYMTLKVALHEALLRSNLTKGQLARRLDLAETEIRRMLDPRHPTKFQRLTEALSELGVGVQVTLHTAGSSAMRSQKGVPRRDAHVSRA